MREIFEKIIDRLEERTDFLSDCTKYGNKDAEQQNKSYSTMMMYEVADLVDDLIEIVKQEAEQYTSTEHINCLSDSSTNGWIPCSERLPDNAEHKGSICPRYHVMTIYGQTVGWFNPDYDSWFVLVWFMTARYLESEIDMERGDIPKVVRAPLKYGIVTAWQPLPEPYQPEGE